MNILNRFDILRNKDKNNSFLDFTLKQESIDTFISLINIDCVIRAMYDDTDSSNDFFKSFKDVKTMLSILGYKDLTTELFYSVKLGYGYSEFPHEMVYLVDKAIKMYKYPNFSVSKIKEQYITKFYSRYEDLTSIEVLLSRLCKFNVKLVSKYRPVVHEPDGLSEMYIYSTDDIIVLPTDIAKSLSLSDIKSIDYKKDLGFCIGNTPLRTIGGRLGLTVSDYLMTEVI